MRRRFAPWWSRTVGLWRSFSRPTPRTAEAFRKAPGEVEFAVDAGKVHTREEGWKAPKIAVIRSPLLARGWTGVCTWVGELLSVTDEGERERRRAISDRTVGYFSKHVGRLNCTERLGAGRAIGSGAVEGQAKRWDCG